MKKFLSLFAVCAFLTSCNSCANNSNPNPNSNMNRPSNSNMTSNSCNAPSCNSCNGPTCAPSCNAPSCQAGSNSSDYSDSSITMRVKNAIVSDNSLSVNASLVGVSTTDGVVTLTGAVASRDEMNAIVRKAKAVPGVKGVNNQMTLSS